LAIVLAAVDSCVDCHKAILAALKDSNKSVRRAAAVALVNLKTVEGLAAVVASDGHGTGIREQAARCLGDLGPAAAEAIPALFAYINNSSTYFKSSAPAAALGAIGEPAVPFLVYSLKHGSEMARFESAIALMESTAIVPQEIKDMASKEIEDFWERVKRCSGE
jgi:HEAT repeat protein